MYLRLAPRKFLSAMVQSYFMPFHISLIANITHSRVARDVSHHVAKIIESFVKVFIDTHPIYRVVSR